MKRKIEKLYVLSHPPVNRNQKRAFQREADHINKELLPIIQAFNDTYPEPTEDQVNYGNSVYQERCNKVNANKKYVISNKDAFLINVNVIKQEEFKEYVTKKPMYAAWIIIAFLFLLSLFVIFSTKTPIN